MVWLILVADLHEQGENSIAVCHLRDSSGTIRKFEDAPK